MWNIAKKTRLEDRVALPEEEGGKAEEREKVNRGAKQEECNNGKREFEGEMEVAGFVKALVMNLTLA